MTTNKLQLALKSQFENQRFVFWHDEDGHLSQELEAFDDNDINVIHLDKVALLALKVELESASPQSKWLLYSQKPIPASENDWLLDVRMRSKPFYADEVSMQFDELGLNNFSLRDHLKNRSEFLRAKDRFERFKRLVLPDDIADDLDRKMIAVIFRSDQSDLFSVLLRVFTSFDTSNEVNLIAEPKGWAELTKFGLVNSFWALVKNELGYEDSEPSLRDLLFRIMVSDLNKGLLGNLPIQLTHFQLPDRAKAASASVFLSQWRGNITHFNSYNNISTQVAEQLNISNQMSAFTAEEMLDAMTFSEIEKVIIRDLRNRILTGAGTALEAVRAVFIRRRDGHWANPKLAANSKTTKGLVCCYEALEAAADIFALRATHEQGFSFASALQGAEAYTSQLFRFDQTYRHFHRAAEQVDALGWTLLQELRNQVEELYTGWFVPQLSEAWSKVIEGEQGLLANWQLQGWTLQDEFYKREVKTIFETTNVKRVFVIISDAFRYEAAEELYSVIVGRNKVKVTLTSMLGVLPSYTTLGMAALLPHETLAYKVSKDNKNANILADGLATATLEDRDAVLERHGGTAINWEDFLALGKVRAYERVKNFSIVYIYHDRIDLLGDKQSSERKTFEAVSDTLKELNDLVGFVMSNLNASTILVTADHGFLYQESALDIADKSTLDIHVPNAIKTKKRYVLGRELGKTDKAWCGNTAQTGGTTLEGSLDYWVPKGATRFHFVGGARFVHGSAMPQEIVVPLLTIKLTESETAKISHVNIVPMLLSNKVVNNLPKFEFIQTDSVSAKVLPRTVNITLRDGETSISSEHTITFDSDSSSLDERKKSVILTLKAGNYDTKKDYFLVLRDTDSKVELHRVAVKIDLALANDF